MRKMLILGGVGVLTAAAWMMTLSARAQGLATARSSSSAQDGIEFRTTHVRRGHAGRFGHTFYATEVEIVPYVGSGQPELGPAEVGMFTSGAILSGAEHMTAGHLVIPASHPLVHVPALVEQGEPLGQQPTAPGADGSDQADTATAQPDPTADPMAARPPGATGPGRPAFGWCGPGLPGPGRPARPGW
jgi:hypothetical protein